MTTNHGDELGTDRSQRHWRLVTVQAGGGLTVVRQKNETVDATTSSGRVPSKTLVHRGGDRRHPPWR